MCLILALMFIIFDLYFYVAKSDPMGRLWARVMIICVSHVGPHVFNIRYFEHEPPAAPQAYSYYCYEPPVIEPDTFGAPVLPTV